MNVSDSTSTGTYVAHDLVVKSTGKVHRTILDDQPLVLDSWEERECEVRSLSAADLVRQRAAAWAEQRGERYFSGGIVSDDALVRRNPAPHAAVPLMPTSKTVVVTIGPEPECPTALLRDLLPLLKRLGRHGRPWVERAQAIVERN